MANYKVSFSPEVDKNMTYTPCYGFYVLKSIVRFSSDDWGDADIETQLWNKEAVESGSGKIIGKYHDRNNNWIVIDGCANSKEICIYTDEEWKHEQLDSIVYVERELTA